MLEKIRKINLRGINFKIVFLLMLLSIAVYFFYFKPSLEILQDVKEEISLLDEDTEQAFIYISQSEKRLEELRELEEEIDKLESRVPPSANLPLFFAELEEILLNSAPNVESINISEISSPEDLNYRFFTINLSFTSSRNEILQYIRDIENFSRVLKIEQVNFREEDNSYSGTLRIRAFLSV